MPDLGGSNASQVFSDLERWLDGFGFDRPGDAGMLGNDVIDTVIHGLNGSGGILERCANKTTPEGGQWKEIDKDYAEDKEKKYGWRDINYRTGQMLNEDSLTGRPEIERLEIRWHYGLDIPPPQSYSPTGYIDDHDKNVRDTEKAGWAHENERRFFGWNVGDKINVVAVMQENLDEYIRHRR